jgi:hypothetical protein
MTSINGGMRIGGLRQEVDQQKLGPALLIASSLVLAIRTARWNPTHSDAMANVDLEKEVEHSVRIAKIVMSHLTGRYPELFPLKDVAWYAPGDDEVPK